MKGKWPMRHTSARHSSQAELLSNVLNEHGSVEKKKFVDGVVCIYVIGHNSDFNLFRNASLKGLIVTILLKT
jgi:hypothetical protein